MPTYQCSFCFYIFDLNLEVIENYIQSEQLSSSTKEKESFAMEISGNSSRNFWSNGKRPISARAPLGAYSQASFLNIIGSSFKRDLDCSKIVSVCVPWEKKLKHYKQCRLCLRETS